MRKPAKPITAKYLQNAATFYLERYPSTAERFGVEEIIDPRDTRRLLCEFANLAAPMRKPGPRSFGYRP